MIRFRLPPGVARFDPEGKLEELRAEFSELFSQGFTQEYPTSPTRAPVEGETVVTSGFTSEFTVRHVKHHYDATDPLRPHVYVTLG